jgi:uncharacterized protein (DUF302 family)
MHINIFLKKTLLLSVLILAGCISSNETDSHIYEKVSDYSFEDTLMNLDIAIAEHNYRIIHRSNIGKAIRERGDVDFPLSTVTSFCNISYAKEMMLINPNLINDMPCNIAVREQEHTVLVSSKLMNEHIGSLEQQTFAKKINDNLISIIEATVE